MEFKDEAAQLIQEGHIDFFGFLVDVAATETGDFMVTHELFTNRFTAVVPNDRQDEWFQGVANTLAAIYRRIA